MLDKLTEWLNLSVVYFADSGTEIAKTAHFEGRVS